MDEKVDVIIAHLERLDRRDRLRMWGGTVRSVIALIPMLFFLWSAWYLYAHGTEIFDLMLQQSARSAATSTGQSYEQALDAIRAFFGQDPE